MRRQPATPFWTGYSREPEVEVALIEAMARALHDHPTWRFGQIVTNLFGDEPWLVWDEDAIEILNGTAR